jgi:hypothetical protein
MDEQSKLFQHKDDEVAFLLSVPSESSPFMNEDMMKVKNDFENIALKFHAEANFGILTSKSITTISLFKIEKDKFITKELSLLTDDGYGYLPTNVIQNFILTNNRKLITKVDLYSYKKLSSLKRLMMFLIVDYEQFYTNQLMELFEETVGELTHEQNEKFVFGELDGIRWIKWCRQYDVKSFPSILILDTTSTYYYTIALELPDSSVTSINSNHEKNKRIFQQTLLNALENSLEMKMFVKKGFGKRIYEKIQEYYPWSILIVILPLLLLGLMVFLPYPNDKDSKKRT